MRRPKWNRTMALALSGLVALGLAACGDDEDDAAGPTTTVQAAPQGSPTVNIDMIDHRFEVTGGPLVAGGTLRMANRGSEFHMVAFGKLKPGRTLADVERALSEAGGPPGGGAPSTTVGGATTTSARGATTTTARGATTTTARGATTTTARGATTTTAAGGAGGEGEREDPTAEFLDQVGLPGAFMSPGESADVMVPNLQPGSYALLCFIPTEGEGPPHFAKGMIGQLDVVAGPAPPPPTADATYKLAPGQAVEGPATLTAGRHVLKFEAVAGSEQLEPSLLRLNAGTTYTQLDAAFVELFESEEPPAKGAATRVPGQVVYGGFDLEGVTSFYLTVDLKAGNYALVAEDTDEETPGTPKEIINIKVG